MLANRKEAAKLREDMKHVEAVIKMFDPGFNLRPVAVKRRKLNPWFKRGTIFRHAMDVLREATGPLTSREIAERMLAARGIQDAPREVVAALAVSVQSSMTNHDGKAVARHGEGTPSRWRIWSGHPNRHGELRTEATSERVGVGSE
ncbi:MAG TPA: hypothetical protein VF601_17240 [Beijerinckiaceae bacterium]|jgi:hypothetical protein